MARDLKPLPGVVAVVDRRFGGNVRAASTALQIPYSTLHEMYVGKRPNPSVHTLDQIAESVGTTIDFLFHGRPRAAARAFEEIPHDLLGAGEAPADELIRSLSHPSIARRLSAPDRIRSALDHALLNPSDFNEAQMHRLYAWFDLLLSQHRAARTTGEGGAA